MLNVGLGSEVGQKRIAWNKLLMWSFVFYVMAGCFHAMNKSSRITTLLPSKEIFWLKTKTS